MRPLHIVAVVAVAGLLWAGIAHLQQTRREAREAAIAAEQRIRAEADLAARIESEQQAKRERAARQHALAGALVLRDTLLQNPALFDLQSATIQTNGATCYSYRYRGGSVRRAIYDAKLVLYVEDGKRPFPWEQICTGDGGREVVEEVKARAPAPSSVAKQASPENVPLANTDAVKGAIVVPLGPSERQRPRPPPSR